MSAKAVICILFGLGFVFIPETFASFYDMSINESGVLMSRFFGQAFILLGVLLWLARNTSEQTTQRAFSISVFIGDIVGFVIALIAQISGVVNALGWVSVAIYLVLALGFGYFIIAKPSTT
jgi:Ca2+/Na+ antiporter